MKTKGKKITADNISNIKKDKIFFDKLKVQRIGADFFEIIGFYYGEEESRFKGGNEEVAKYLNGYFGL
ncbi:hypothetical protein [Metabacillus fastidiosus]|uniref:hypothetical protein n=1 Tax=Metabacillus fastidiosus TaxID=1458 RepID=UPI002E21442D|nr:hypothetical protein [Metabacillus fastidiosus]